MPRAVRVLALAALLLLLPALPASAQTPADVLILQDETWEDGTTYRDVSITVAEGATVTVRGARVTLDNVSIRIERNATLLVESLPGQPSRIEGGARGWQVHVNGTARLLGLPDDRVVLDGLVGTSAFAGTTALATGGFAFAAGTLEARDLLVENYTSGFLLNGGRADVDRVHFRNGTGIALVLTSMPAHVSNATFEGPGGSLFISIANGTARLSDLTFKDVETAITLRGLHAELDRIRVTNASVCLSLVALTEVRARDVECGDFRRGAVVAQPVQTLRAGTANLTLTHFRAWTNETVEAAIVGQNSRLIRLEDSVVGPVRGAGLVLTDAAAEYENVRFQGVTHFAAVYINPPENATFDVPGTGEPGNDGWIRVVRKSAFRIVDADGHAVNHARFDVRTEDTKVVVFSNKSLDDAFVAPALDALVIDKRGGIREPTYLVQAGNATAGATLAGYVPTQRVTELVLAQGEAPKFSENRNTPAAGLLAGLAVLALAAGLRRR